MRFNNLVKWVIAFFLGSIVTLLNLIIRNKNPKLRKEMIYYLQQGDAYFDMFIILDFLALFTLIICFLIIHFYFKYKTSQNQRNRKK